VFRFKIIIAMLCSIIWQVLQLEYYFNKWKKLSIGIDFGIGIDQNSWYRYRYRYRPKKLVSPITRLNLALGPYSVAWSLCEPDRITTTRDIFEAC
jgi:hypothetical protein